MYTDAHIEGGRHVRMKAEIGMCIFKPRNLKDCQQTTRSQKRGQNEFPLAAQPAPRRNQSCQLFETSSLQHFETISSLNQLVGLTF